jgi:SAM-dependent methyltransferase
VSQIEPESPYDFRDPKLAAAWEAQIRSESAWRQGFFDEISAALNDRFNTPFSVLELGSGPGHLALAIRSSTAVRDYVAVDYSPAMHALARSHLGSLAGGVRFEVRDFRRPDWTERLGPFDAAVTMMAAHEVRRRERLTPLFAQVASVLSPGGLFLFADFYATGPADDDLYLAREGQAEALRVAGFGGTRLLLDAQGMALHAAVRCVSGADDGSSG